MSIDIISNYTSNKEIVKPEKLTEKVEK